MTLPILAIDIGTYPTYAKTKINTGKVQTTDATATTIFSVPMPASSSCFVNISFACSNAAFTTGLAQTPITGYFLRSAAGNVVSAGTTVAVGLNISLAVNPPVLTMVANTSTQSIDIKVTGQAATTYNWHVEGNYILGT